ncbi:MAG: hypothetical protein V4684_19435 [Pseudomonadota bacterium]
MQFQLNRPALQTAGQILNQQCGAAAAARRGALAAPTAGDLALSAITSLASAISADKAPVVGEGYFNRMEFEAGLARAVMHIFDLAATRGIELGEVIADQLAQPSVPSKLLAA